VLDETQKRSEGSMRFARLAAACAAALAFGCSTAQRVATEKALAEALVSDQQETQLGLQVRQELETKQHVVYLDDPVVSAYVAEVTGKLVPLAQRERPGVQWSVRVIDDPATVNAFATPGGFLYVYSGLLLAAADTAEVAGVMAHEAGHVVARHSARRMVAAHGLEAVTAMALGQNASGVAQLAAGLAGKGVLLAHGRSEELEADESGVRYAAAAGYDPHGIATFFTKLEVAEHGKTMPVWLSTHPATPDRVAKAEANIRRLGLSGRGGRDPAPLEKVKARLRAHRPAAR